MSRVKYINNNLNDSRDYIILGINNRIYNYYMVVDGTCQTFYCNRNTFILLLLDEDIAVSPVSVAYTKLSRMRIIKAKKYLRDDSRFIIYKDVRNAYLKRKIGE